MRLVTWLFSLWMLFVAAAQADELVRDDVRIGSIEVAPALLLGRPVVSLAVTPDASLLLAIAGSQGEYWQTPTPELLVFDLADPRAPRLIGTARLPGAQAVVLGRKWPVLLRPYYEARNEPTFLALVDLTDPSRPRVASSLPVHGPAAFAAAPDQATLYLNEDSGRRLATYDITDADRPRRIAASDAADLELYDGIWRVAALGERPVLVLVGPWVRGGYAVGHTWFEGHSMTGEDGRISFVDMADPTRPRLTGAELYLDLGLDAVVADDGRGVLLRAGALHALEAAGDTVRRGPQIWAIPARGTWDAVAAWSAYVAALQTAWNRWLVVYATPPSSIPRRLAWIGIESSEQWMAIAGVPGTPLAFIGATDGLHLIDVTRLDGDRPTKTKVLWTSHTRGGPIGQPATTLPHDPAHWTVDEAARFMASDPGNAAAAFRRDGGERAAVYLALLVQTQEAPSDRRARTVWALLESVELTLRQDGMHWWGVNAFTENLRYDGSLRSMEGYLLAASVIFGTLTLPCALVEAHPSLLSLVASEERDGPRVDCDTSAQTELPSVATYLGALHVGQNTHCDAMHRTGDEHASSLARRIAPAWFLDPLYSNWSLLPHYVGEEGPAWLLRVPLDRWSLLGRWNRQRFLEVLPLFLRARMDLARHFETLGLTAEDAMLAAHRALWNEADFAYQNEPEVDAVRAAILTGRPVDHIEALLLSPDLAGVPTYQLGYVGSPEPLLMVAATRPDVIRLLLLHGADPDERSELGKTPLMMAAQFDNAASVRVLLEAGADVDTTTFHHADVPDNASDCSTYSIRHGLRTALMYAAANARLPVIELLLEAGADPAAVDSQGFSAFDYLIGNGPVAANPRLSPAEMETAIRLLQPSAP